MTPSLLKLRYPAFATVADTTIAYWLDDARRIVTEDWGADYEAGMLSLAAHNMSQAGTPGIGGDSTGQIPLGVTRFRSASMDVAISEAAANRGVTGGYAASPYGQEFAVLLRRHTGGPRLVGYVEPACGYGW